MLVFSGSSNPGLAKKIAQKLGTRLGRIELTRFSNDEARVWIKEKNPGRIAVLVQSLSTPTDQHLVEFCLICDALQRLGVKKIISVIPWLAYCRQDKVFRSGEPISIKVVAKILELNALEKLITYDLHHPDIAKLFRIPVTNLSGRRLFNRYYQDRIDAETVVVAPDKGAYASSKRFARDLGLAVAFIDKHRDLTTGKVTIRGIDQEVSGKKILIKDDMISTGSTLLAISRFLTARKVKSIKVCATHHLYVPGAQAALDKSPISQITVTDTIKPKGGSKKLKVISVAETIAAEIGA